MELRQACELALSEYQWVCGRRAIASDSFLRHANCRNVFNAAGFKLSSWVDCALIHSRNGTSARQVCRAWEVYSYERESQRTTLQLHIFVPCLVVHAQCI